MHLTTRVSLALLAIPALPLPAGFAGRSSVMCLGVLGLAVALLAGCSGVKAQQLPPPGVEIAAESGAEDGANRPLDGKVTVSDAELKAAAKRAKQAALDAQVARGRKSKQTQSQRDRDREEGKDRETDALDGEDKAEQKTAAKPERKPLPRNPNPPATVAAPADVATPPVDAARTPSGVWHKVQKPGTGSEHPTDEDTVVVHYTGWTTDGKMFDSSVTRGVPVRLSLSQVITGWRDGVRLMVVGETRRLWIPEQLAYQGRAGAPRGMLVFDVELVDIESP